MTIDDLKIRLSEEINFTDDGYSVMCCVLDEYENAQNTAYKKCAEELMRDISGRRGYDLFACDEDIVDEIKQSLEAILRTHFR